MTQVSPESQDALPAGDGTPAPRRSARSRWVALVAMLGTAALIFVTMRHYIRADAVLAHYGEMREIVSHSRLLALAGYVLAYYTAVCLSIPGAIMMTAMGGLLFGAVGGALAAAFAAGSGAIVVFLVARSAIGPLLARDAGPRMARFARGLQEDAPSVLLFLRLTPIVPFFVINVAAALFGVPLSTFAWCTYLGILPAAFALAAAGSALDGVIMAQKASVDACRAAGGYDCSFDFSFRMLLTPNLMGALLALGIVALLPAILKHTGLMARLRGRT